MSSMENVTINLKKILQIIVWTSKEWNGNILSLQLIIIAQVITKVYF